MQSITVNPKYLRSLRHIMAQKDIRYYLNGVHVQCSDAGKFYTATDGHRIAVYREPWQDGEEIQSFEIIIPGETINAIKPHKKIPRAVLSQEGATWKLDTYNGPALLFQPVEGRFPDWRRVIPQKTSGEPGAYNWDYLADFNACARDGWGARYAVELYQNGAESVAVVKNGNPDFVGALMPMRANTPTASVELPDWLTAPCVAPEVAETEAAETAEA